MHINPSTWPFIKATPALKQVATSNAKRIIHGEGEREEGVSQLLDWTKLTVGCGAGSQRANAPANFLANPTLISQLSGQHTHSRRLSNTWDEYNYPISNEDQLTQSYFVYIPKDKVTEPDTREASFRDARTILTHWHTHQDRNYTSN